MSFIHPIQIKDAVERLNDLEEIKQSYSATKVLTTVEKVAGDEIHPTVYYSVDEYLQLMEEASEKDEAVTDEDIASIFQDSV